MATASTNEISCRISQGLYTIANSEIGNEDEVRIRRQNIDVLSMNSCEIWKKYLSGSRAEGFAFNSSDFDLMYVDKEVLVVDCELQNVLSNTHLPITLLMETDNVPPGFTLLKRIRCDSTALDDFVPDAFCPRGDGVYFSSEKTQQFELIGGKTSVHGPCRSGTLYGHEYDCAYTLGCPFWPKLAESFIHRSVRKEWPTTDDLIDICKDGCLLVPISSKQRSLSDNADLEWRISFSLAEKKLVYSMNHCQFLCYGLMKIFLNEVLKGIPETKTESGNVLCSYFMKTAVFWEISEGANDWSDQNFLDKFFNVFRRFIKWVEEGYCPNFFIPEQNMFYGKIYGRRQRELMLRLRLLDNSGIECLYHCNSLWRFQRQVNQRDDFAYKKERAVIQMLTLPRITTNCTSDINAMIKALNYTCSCSYVSNSAEMLSAIRLSINYHLQNIAIILAKHDLQNLTSNKRHYLRTKRRISVLRSVKTTYCLGVILQAVISYLNRDYDKTIKLIDHMQQRLQDKKYMYRWELDSDLVMESRKQGMSSEKIVKSFVLENYMYVPVVSIPDLTLESIIAKQNSPGNMLLIPPLVFSYFLVILSYTGLDKPDKRNVVLESLHSVLHDKNLHIEIKCKEISWEILGICQQLCGKYVGAYQSYLNALNAKYNEFQEATIIRILMILFKLHNL